MSLAYRDFDGSDADYELLVEIMNSESQAPSTADQLRAGDERWNRDNFMRREFVVLEDKCIGEASCWGKSSAETGFVYCCGLRLMPGCGELGLEEEIYAHLVELAETRGARTVMAFARDAQTGRTGALSRMGFQCIMREPWSQLDLEQFNASRFAATVRNVREQGIAIRSLAELEEAGVDWLHPLCKTFNELVLDVPRSDPEPPPPLGLDKFGGWNMLPWQFVALDGERWVGYSGLSPLRVDTNLVKPILTGVVRSHRRRGIATALKVTAMGGAKAAGVRFVMTRNEENSPMLHLNLRLGFRRVYALLTYRLAL